MIDVKLKDNQYLYICPERIVQWDEKPMLQISNVDTSKEVRIHFSLTKHHGNARRVDAKIVEDGKVQVDIPRFIVENDESYLSEYEAYAWLYLKNGNVGKTVAKIVFKVDTKAKPEDYVHTEEELKTWETLEKRIKKVEENGGHSGDVPTVDDILNALPTWKGGAY